MKTIPLTQGKFTIVDDDDYDSLNQWKWQYLASGYAYRTNGYLNGKQQHIMMHRQIMSPSSRSVQVDHINGAKLDNRRANLRFCNPQQNNFNAGMSRNNTSGYKGVAWHKQKQKWRSFIKIHYQQISLGLYETPEDAAHVYDQAALQLYGEYARLNLSPTA